VLRDLRQPLRSRLRTMNCAAEVGLQDAEREVEVLVPAASPGVGSSGGGGADRVVAVAGGDVLELGDLGRDTGHNALHRFGRVNEGGCGPPRREK